MDLELMARLTLMLFKAGVPSDSVNPGWFVAESSGQPLTTEKAVVELARQGAPLSCRALAVNGVLKVICRTPTEDELVQALAAEELLEDAFEAFGPSTYLNSSVLVIGRDEQLEVSVELLLQWTRSFHIEKRNVSLFRRDDLNPLYSSKTSIASLFLGDVRQTKW